MFCTQCGKRNPDLAQFCFACGTALPVVSTDHVAKTSTTGSVTRVDRQPTNDFVEGSTRTGAANDQVQYAGFWIRFAGAMIDSLVITAVSIVSGVVVAGFALLIASDSAPEAGIAAYYLVSFLTYWLYFALAESSSHQATWGKRAVGIIVTDVHGRRLSFGRASGRVFAKLLNGLTMGVGWIMAGFTAKKRALHDYVAGTLVTREESSSRMSIIVIAVVAIGAVPLIGIVAAIAIPGLVRARMSGNEASAIGSLRTLHSAQQDYSLKCNGYAPDLAELIRVSGVAFGEASNEGVIERSGYGFTLQPSTDAIAVELPSSDCMEPVSDYFALASPITPGTTGTRYFATNETGTIYQDVNETFTSATPLE